MKKNLTAVDLFCGCGGFSLGFMQAGWNVVVGIDNEFSALHTYWVNLCGKESKWINLPEKLPRGHSYDEVYDSAGTGWISHHSNVTPIKAVIQADIYDIDADDIFDAAGIDKIGIVVGGPPCPSFSSIGKRKVGDPRDYLVFEFARLVLEINPTCLCMENVPGIKSKKLPDGRHVMDVLIKIIKDHDWELYYEIKYDRWWWNSNIIPPKVERIQVSVDDLPEGVIDVIKLR